MPPNERWLDAAWGDHATGRVVRTVLAPAEWAYRAAIAARNAAYDRGWTPSVGLPLPAVSIGNVSVGGTGKTPVAAWMAQRLRSAGATPGIVLRGYGGDEADVHALLNPSLVVIADADRVAGARAAHARGCDVVVLDDAFQHRRARRDVDVVLASADVPWTTHCLPAGPLREPWSSVRRADLVAITRKAATPDASQELAMRLRRVGARDVVVVDLRLGDLHDAVHDDVAPLPFHQLEGRKVLAIAGVGNPGAFFAQLRAAGAYVNPAPWPDHHAYTMADVAELFRRVPAVERVVCTLKDAVKLRRLWPRSGPTLWYVSQRVELVDGQGAIEGIVRRLLTARSAAHD